MYHSFDQYLTMTTDLYCFGLVSSLEGEHFYWRGSHSKIKKGVVAPAIGFINASGIKAACDTMLYHHLQEGRYFFLWDLRNSFSLWLLMVQYTIHSVAGISKDNSSASWSCEISNSTAICFSPTWSTYFPPISAPHLWGQRCACLPGLLNIMLNRICWRCLWDKYCHWFPSLVQLMWWTHSFYREKQWSQAHQ